MHTNSDKEITVVLEGPLAEIMARIDLQVYRKHITKNGKGKPLLYVKVHKALYGLLRSALLFYRRLVAELEDIGFELNPYDPCVANKVVNGTQMTVVGMWMM